MSTKKKKSTKSWLIFWDREAAGVHCVSARRQATMHHASSVSASANQAWYLRGKKNPTFFLPSITWLSHRRRGSVLMTAMLRGLIPGRSKSPRRSYYSTIIMYRFVYVSCFSRNSSSTGTCTQELLYLIIWFIYGRSLQLQSFGTVFIKGKAVTKFCAWILHVAVARSCENPSDWLKRGKKREQIWLIVYGW